MKPQKKSPRKRDGNGRPKIIPKNGERARKFGVQPVMQSAKFQMDEERKNKDVTTEVQYLRPPPEAEGLLEATIVLPPYPMSLPELAEPSALDAIRRDKEVWIKLPKPNILQIYSRTMHGLQEGVKAVNWAIHDMRLAKQNISTRFLVQMSIKADCDCPISVDLGSRPCTSHQCDGASIETTRVAAHFLEKLGPKFLSSMGALKTINRSLKMQVDFGHVNIRRRKRGVGNTMSYADFTDMAALFGTRGGADLGTRMANVSQASALIAHLQDPTTNIYEGHEPVTYKESIQIKIEGKDLSADIKSLDNGRQNLANSRLVVTDQLPPLSWTMIAPDRRYDWRLQVDGETEVQPIPPLMQDLIQDITVRAGESKSSNKTEHGQCNVHVKNVHKWIDKVSKIHQKWSAYIPFRDTPFMVQVSLNREWQGIDTKADSESWLGIHVIGRHWQGTLNHKRPHESKKDWGHGNRNVWAGSEDAEEGQFAGFLCQILDILSALEKWNNGDKKE